MTEKSRSNPIQYGFRWLAHAAQILRSGRLTRSGLPWLRQHGVPLPMSLPAYAFDNFKQARRQVVPYVDLSHVRWPSQSGLVSLIMPVFNGARYLRDALDSVLAQTYPAWELIAVDDGSTDESGRILDEYAARDVRVRVLHQDNQKLPRALSNGFRGSQGEFLIWISDDNRLFPNCLWRLVDCLQRHPEWDMIYANQDLIDDEGQPLCASPWFRGYQRPLGSEHIFLPHDPSELNTLPNNYVGAAFLYRSRVVGLLGDYSANWFTTEDYDYWLKVNALLTLRHADFTEPVLAYRFHRRSLTSRDQELGIRQLRERLVLFDDFRRDFYLAPLQWCVTGSSDPDALRLADDLRVQIQAWRHALLTPKTPRMRAPLVCVHVVKEPDGSALPDENLPDGALQVLLVTHPTHPLPTTMPARWDVCALVGSSTDLPKLTDPYQGWVSLPNHGALLACVDIRARLHFLAAIETEISHPVGSRDKLTVIICTYRRGPCLEAAIQSVAVQTLSHTDYELIVVNNAPEDIDVVERVERLRQLWFADSPDRLRLIDCHQTGLSFARNVGLLEARGQILCFLDDDAVADPDWLAHIWNAFCHHPKAGVVGGSIVLRKPDPLPAWWKPGMEIYWSGFTSDDPVYRTVDHWSQYPWGANWCARRQALMEIGGFRTRYGRRGKGLGGAEEIIAAALIQKAGYEIGVEPRAQVQHQVDASRFSLGYVWKIVMGGRRSWYRAQLDGYLAWEIGLAWSFRRVVAAARPFSLRSLVRILYRLYAEVQTAGWYLHDLLRRFRKPLSMR